MRRHTFLVSINRDLNAVLEKEEINLEMLLSLSVFNKLGLIENSVYFHSEENWIHKRMETGSSLFAFLHETAYHLNNGLNIMAGECVLEFYLSILRDGTE